MVEIKYRVGISTAVVVFKETEFILCWDPQSTDDNFQTTSKRNRGVQIFHIHTLNCDFEGGV